MSATRSGSGRTYTGFISYSHAGDGDFARRLQREVERFAKPWNRLRAVRLFRDDTNLTASPGLWTSIEAALADSEWFVLLVSPEAAASHWCGEEIGAWLAAHGSVDRILLVLTGGGLAWDREAGDFDREQSTALPPALFGAFAEEPLWVDARWSRERATHDADDPRMQRTVVDVAAAIRGLEKDELVGDAAREHRRTRRLVRVVQASLASLLVLAIVAAGYAWVQRGHALDQKAEAQHQATVAQSRQLAAIAEQQLDSDLGLAAFLAVAAHRLDDNAQTRAALFQAAATSPHLVRFADVGAEVSAIADSLSPEDAVVGLTDGRVVRWRTGSDQVDTLMTLSGPVTQVAQSKDGDTLLASDGTTVSAYAAGAVTSVPLDAAQVTSLAVAPDGTSGWVLAGGSGFEAPQHLWRVDLATSAVQPLPDELPQAFLGGARLIAGRVGRLTVYESTYGHWAVLAADGTTVLNTGSAQFGVKEAIPGASPDGRYLGVANADSASLVHVWDSSSARGRKGFSGLADIPSISSPVALAIGGDGLRVALADSRSLEVVPTAAGARDPEPAELLPGGGDVDVGGLRFLGDDDHLMSVSGQRLTLWDLRQAGRVVSTTGVKLSAGCFGCPPPAVAVSPNGDRVAVVDGSGQAGFVSNLDGTDAVELPGDPVLSYTYGMPVWMSEQDLVVPYTTADGTEPAHPPALPDGIVTWLLDGSNGFRPLASGRTPSGDVVSITVSGRIVVQAASDGRTHAAYASPVRAVLSAAVDPRGRWVAMVVPSASGAAGSVRIIDLSTGRTVRTIDGEHYAAVAFAGSLLLAQRDDGSIQEWSDNGQFRERTLPGDSSFFEAPVAASRGGLIARVRADQSLVVVDTLGDVLGTFASAAGSSATKTGVAFTTSGSTIVTVDEAYPRSLLNRVALSDADLVGADCAVASASDAAWTRLVGDAPYPTDLCGASSD